MAVSKDLGRVFALLTVGITSVACQVNAQAPPTQARVNPGLPTPVAIGEDAQAAPTTPPTPTSPLTPDAASIPNTLDFVPPAGAIPNFSSQGAANSLGATRGSNSAAPNMIGDLFNSGSSSLFLSAQTRTNVVFSSPPAFSPGMGQIVDATTVTATLSSPQGVGGILDPGRVYAVNQYSNATRFFNVEGTGPVTGNTVQAVVPVTNAAIFSDVNAALQQEFPELAGVHAEDFVEINYDPANSVLNLDSSNTQVQSADYFYDVSVTVPIPSSPGEVVGRYTIAENNSPLPRDRVFLDYNFFHRARVSVVPVPVNRWTPGFEKTFGGGLGSVELRVPMAVTLSSDVDFTRADLMNYEFGDVSMSFKVLLMQTRKAVVSGGLGVSLPTANDFVYRDGSHRPLIQVENQSVHLLPYLAALITPNDRIFFQSFGQLDIDTNGNSVFINEAFSTNGFNLVDQGRLRSQTLLRLSASAGAFLFKRPERNLSAMALAFETHYTSTLDHSKKLGNDTIATGDPTRSLNVVNLTTGLHTFVGKSVITTAYGVPVTSDRVYDGELRVFFNRYF